MPQEPKLLDQVCAAIRACHYSIRTEKAYVSWIRRFILFHGKRHPRDMGEREVTVFHHGRTASYPAAPVQIPACGTTARGSSKLLALHSGGNNIIPLLLRSCGICVVSGVRKPLSVPQTLSSCSCVADCDDLMP
ncbi:MAG TPA: hypothetical protein ENH13_00285 [Euryarchaeota archaeon]|nr:hypothetical protein [Euryarchaeota archaeon]